MDYFWWMLGYNEDYSPSDADIKNRHEMMTQVKKSKLKLKCVEVVDKTKTLLNEKDCIGLLHKVEEEKVEEYNQEDFIIGCCDNDNKTAKDFTCHCECETCNCICDFDCDNTNCSCSCKDTPDEQKEEKKFTDNLKKEIDIDEKKRKIEERLKKRKFKS